MLEQARRTVSDQLPFIPETAIVLGSGLGLLAEELTKTIAIQYKDIAGFPQSTAPGHKSRLLWGYLGDTAVLILQGRFHFYEGYSLEQIVYPVNLLKTLGCVKLVLTNAAGGIKRSYRPGDLMLITDHINFTGRNPLKGDDFADMSRCYSREMINLMAEAAQRIGIDLKRGTYGWTMGPSFETASEIQMMRILGAHAVGMSTVPEVIAAASAGMEVTALSCISNMACGILAQPITGEEVMETGRKVRNVFAMLIKEFLKISREE